LQPRVRLGSSKAFKRVVHGSLPPWIASGGFSWEGAGNELLLANFLGLSNSVSRDPWKISKPGFSALPQFSGKLARSNSEGKNFLSGVWVAGRKNARG
jgi:hypothetical protein